MELELFANTNSQAYQAGLMIGIMIAVLISASIPISVGAKKGQPVLGLIGGICAGGTALFFGCLGGLPVAGVFAVIIMAVGSGDNKRFQQDAYEEEEEYSRRRRYQ